MPVLKQAAWGINMKRHHGNIAAAMALAVLLVLPAAPAQDGGARAVPNIVVHVSTLSTGNTEETVTFEQEGSDTSLSLRLPNGATVLDASLNVTGLPLTEGGTDYPGNVTVDAGPQLPVEWAFRNKGYGDLGRQSTFTSGAEKATLMIGMNDTNSTYFNIPKAAEVLAANVTLNGSATSNLTIAAGAGGTNVFPFGSGAFRFQWLYLASEINTGGMFDKAGWKVNSGTGGSSTLSNFKMKLCNTTVTALTTTFDSNYGGATPMTVIDNASFQISESGGYVTLDPPDVFYYDSTKSLLIEVSFSARVGTGFGLNAGAVAGGVGARRSWNSDYTGSTCSVDGNAYRYECRLEFLSKLDMSVDLLNDNVVDYSTTETEWKGANLVFTQELAAYLAAAPVNFTDQYGNAFVTVPLKVSMVYAGNMIFSGLSVAYKYTATVYEVKATSSLAEALGDLLPSTYDGQYTNITLEIYSNKPGKVRVSGISIDFRPPVHPPFIDSRDPGQDAVFMKENETQHFSINASDEYGYPLSAVWYLDTLEAARDRYNFSYFADYESAGPHSVSVTVNNTMRSASVRWNITVVNVNRPPVVNSFSPGAEVTIREEESVNLAVSASDPDSQDTQLKYSWYVGSTDQGVSADSFRFKTDLRSAGSYSIRVKVTDTGGLSASQSWQVIVTNVNVPPVVDSLSPNLNPRIKETESVTFSVIASDFDKQLLTYRWYLDGSEAGSGQQYVYRAGYDSAGEHAVQAVISDGETNITRNWTVTVENVNRPPVAVIDRPAGQAEFMDTASINFSGLSSSDPDKEALRYKWLEGSRELSTSAEFERKFPPGVHEVALEVTDTNRAVSRATVKFTVRYVKLVSNIEWDLVAPVEGNRLTFTAWVNNTGDAAASEVGVEFLVDGQSLGTQTIDSIAGGGTGSATFSWKARKGEHALGVKIGNQSWNSTVAVAQRPAPPASDMTLPLMIGAVAAVAAVGALAFVMTRKKRVQAAPAVPPVPAAPAMAAPPPPAPPAPAAPAVAAAPPPVPTMDLEKRDRVRKLIISTQEKVADLIENPREGVDVGAAMGALEQAQKQMNEGDYDGALRLAKQARSSLAASAAPAAAPAPEPAEAPAQKPRACPKCAERLEPGWGMCPSCGEKV
jgi:hypothetical protein